MINRAFSEINRYNYPYQIVLRVVKHQSFVIHIISLLGGLCLFSINLFLVLISKLVPLTPETAVGHVITGNLKIISDSRILSFIAKGHKYMFPVQIDFQKIFKSVSKKLQHLLMKYRF